MIHARRRPHPHAFAHHAAALLILAPCIGCEMPAPSAPAPVDAPPEDACSSPIACREAPARSHRVCVVTSGFTCAAALRTDDGAERRCASCGDCAAASEQVAQWCTRFAADAGSVASDAGSTCIGPVPCVDGGVRSYRTCPRYDGGACVGAALVASDGRQFLCSSCVDCAAANQEVDAWCRQSLDGGTTDGASDGAATDRGAVDGSVRDGGATDGARDVSGPSDAARDAPSDAAVDVSRDAVLGLSTVREPRNGRAGFGRDDDDLA